VRDRRYQEDQGRGKKHCAGEQDARRPDAVDGAPERGCEEGEARDVAAGCRAAARE
jgi:hypothetical protein